MAWMKNDELLTIGSMKYTSNKRISLTVSSSSIANFLPSLFFCCSLASGVHVIAWMYRKSGSDISRLLSAGSVIFSTVRNYQVAVSRFVSSFVSFSAKLVCK